MKKSKIVTIGLLVLSISSCHKKKSNRPTVGEWENGNRNAYVSTNGGGGYYSANGGFPIWLYYYMLFRPGMGYGYGGGAAYHTHYYSNGRGYSRSSISEGGHAYRGSSSGYTARGGFGSSGRVGG